MTIISLAKLGAIPIIILVALILLFREQNKTLNQEVNHLNERVDKQSIRINTLEMTLDKSVKTWSEERSRINNLQEKQRLAEIQKRNIVTNLLRPTKVKKTKKADTNVPKQKPTTDHTPNTESLARRANDVYHSVVQEYWQIESRTTSDSSSSESHYDGGM